MSQDPLIERAARGELPQWTRASTERRRHMMRVSDLMGAWANALRLPAGAIRRARAAGLLHDALRDESPERLRAILADRATSREETAEAEEAVTVAESEETAAASFPESLLHGPAAARLLRREGIEDEAFLKAVAFHTTGHPDFDAMGRLLYLADFLEPQRSHRPDWLAELRERMPRERDAVLKEVMEERIGHALRRGWPLRAETVGLWNRLAGEQGNRW